MGTDRPPRRSKSWIVSIWIALSTLGLITAGAGLVALQPASADEPRVATSVCEAHELKAILEQNPDAAVEIPAEFDKPFPSKAACDSHVLAWDDLAEGPRQPIPFSHQHHAGEWEIDCMYCHQGTDRSQMAGVPSVELCMGCHEHFPAEYDELEGIQILKKHWEEQTPIEWVQIHRNPEHVQFQHQAHVRAGFECQDCHGPVQEMHKLYLVPDTQWWQYGLPAQKLEMGWCIMCHRENGGPEDCYACHY